MFREALITGFGFCILSCAGVAVAGPALDGESNRAPVHISAALSALGDTTAAPVTNADGLIDFRVLKTFLPENLPGLKRAEVTGQKLGPLDMTIAFAKAYYTNEFNATAEIKISDMNSVGGQIMLSAQANWTAIELDRETDSGYDKTLIIDTFKAREQYDFAEKNGSIVIVVMNRFFIEINTASIEPATMRVMATHLDLKKLAAIIRKPEKAAVVAPVPVTNSTSLKKNSTGLPTRL